MRHRIRHHIRHHIRKHIVKTSESFAEVQIKVKALEFQNTRVSKYNAEESTLEKSMTII